MGWFGGVPRIPPEAFRVDEVAFRNKSSKIGEIKWNWCQKMNM